MTMVFDRDIDMGFAILDLRGFSPLQGPKKMSRRSPKSLLCFFSACERIKKSYPSHPLWSSPILNANIKITGHLRNLNWRHLPYIRPIC